MEDANFAAMLSPTAPATALSRFVHYRWTLPIIAELHATDGAKFITLVNRLGLSKDSLSRTLEALAQQGWVMRNPGYGHPLRPEYILTPAGMLLGDPCYRLMQVLQSYRLEDTALRKWSLPILLVLGQGATRFSDILSAFPGITTRAVTLALKDLQGSGLVQETGAGYGLTALGEQLQGPLEALALALLRM